MPGRRTMSAAELEAFHTQFRETHESPGRRKFFFEFKQKPSEEAIRWARFNKPEKASTSNLDSPRSESTYKGPRLETTNQFRFRAPNDPGQPLPSMFLPEAKHRIMKNEDHEYIQQMFVLANISKQK